VGFTTGSRGKVPGKICEKRIRNNNKNSGGGGDGAYDNKSMKLHALRGLNEHETGF
jgi:hypothetical protein